MSKIFLCYNSGDKPTVERLARRSQTEGISSRLGQWNLIPRAALAQGDMGVVFFGPSGLDPSQSQKLRSAIRARTKKRLLLTLPVIARRKILSCPTWIAG